MNLPKPLCEDIFLGKCLPFIGAGFSQNANILGNKVMPVWKDLTKTLIEIGSIEENKSGPVVASIFEKKFGRVQLIETIRNALYSDEVEPGLSHKSFSELPFETIYTTNFDLLLEDSLSQIKKPYRSLVGELQLPFHGGPLTTNIVKMHGDLRHEEHIIITEADYKNYLNQYPVIATHLSAMLITRTAIFIGYSLSDPDFKNIRDVVRSRLGKFERMSYMIQFNQTNEQIEKSLKDNIHIINITAKSSDSKDKKLDELFKEIQNYLDFKQGKRIRLSKPELFETVSEKTFEESSKAVDSSTLFTSSSNFCFVLMPFSEIYDDIYRELIKPVILDNGLEVIRADEIFSPGSIMEQIRSAIQQSKFCIADVTGKNPNVLYELGIAQTIGKPTVLLVQDINDIPFDLKSNRFIIYDYRNLKSIEKAKDELNKTIQQVLGSDRLYEAKELLGKGNNRAAVAMLGVLFEHSLKKLISRNFDLFNKNIRFKLGKRASLGQMLNVLIDNKMIDESDASQFKEIIQLRNQSVHDLQEPSLKEANWMFEQIEFFLKKYLND